MTDRAVYDDQLKIAWHLAQAGAPIFIARPIMRADGTWDMEAGASGYRLPLRWQDTVADTSVVDNWQPGQALCMVTGVLFDVIDIDPRNGGDIKALEGYVPRLYGSASTPSDGLHLLIKSLGVRKCVLAGGVDLQAGDAEGAGRGFVFLAPTQKLSKSTGAVDTYRWIDEPGYVRSTQMYKDDESGAKLRLLAWEKGGGAERANRTSDYNGPAYADLDVPRQAWSDRYVAGVVGRWGERLAEASRWTDGVRDEKGRGWEALVRDFAWAVARLATCPWTGLTEESAADLYELVVPGEMADDDKCRGKWDAGLLRRAADHSADLPPWDGLDDVLVGSDGRDLPELPPQWEDGRVAAWMAHRGLGGMWCWASGLRWLHWDGRRWLPRTEESVREAVRQCVVRLLPVAARAENRTAIKGLRDYLSLGRITAVVALMKGIVEVDGGAFDAINDLLNVGNGVVDLKTGELMPHDPALMMTRITDVRYVPGARSRDWDTCLEALDPEVALWMQVRWGQGATGWPTSDDVLPVMQGSGANGKTTQLVALQKALGDHMVQVPAKLVMANPSDHPTELMTLRGARLAYIDETPEAGTLNVARLKAVLGQEKVTARAIRQDNVTWTATHSLFLSTNYVPNIHETDHGTWRRLALVKFERKYERDDRFRNRVSRGLGGVAEAVLLWVVQGARAWYDADMTMPAAPHKVEADTREWRAESDLVLAFLDDCVVFEQGVAVAAVDLYDSLNEWLRSHRQKVWSDKVASSRLRGHEWIAKNGVHHVRARNKADMATIRRPDSAMEALSAEPWIWDGMRLRSDVSHNDE